MSCYAGWEIVPEVRKMLLEMCPPTHDAVRCTHIMFQPVPCTAPKPPPAQIVVRGMYDDGIVQCLAVAVNGIVVRPHDGFLFHIVVSHLQGFPLLNTGLRMEQNAQLVHEIAPWPVQTVPFMQRADV